MKIVISILFCLMITPLWAGTPDQDPIVSNLRTRYENGIAPGLDDLIGRTYWCQEIIARKGEFQKIDYAKNLAFEMYGPSVRVKQAGSIMNQKDYFFSSHEIQSTLQIGTKIVFDSYRKDHLGFLIGEFSESSTHLKWNLISISNPQALVQSYTLCKLN